MSTLSVLIVDDEPLARARLTRQLQALGDCELLGEAGDAEAALAQVDELDPDLVLLDIEMPGRSGLELARELSARPNPPALIFCTAHDEFALPAFATSAVGYLLKPVSAAQLGEAIARARNLSKPQLKAVAGGQEKPAGRSQIKAVSRRGVQLIPVSAVRCFVADSKYVVAHHDGGETILDESLKELESEFGERFVRVHRNALVAVQHIAGLQKQGSNYCVLLDGVAERPQVSRRLLAGIKSLIEEMA
ncbi:LytR/AlgR family response regulator transcription factor [Microbulbifer hainanensis]|uniref:LytR/AlgR family response regulator transcription factor n=1 Tax=Microbulbifer hainanensis TaxID=2735675 RepID=UPI00186811DE|nr:LytTR family DNA-binding domain-containing protein [Microbulbifer hainanensis]